MEIRSPNWFGGIKSRPLGARGHCSAAGSARVKGGYSLSRKRITPFKSPKRKVLTLQASSSKSCDACRLHFPARGIAAFSVAIRFASAPTIRCCAAVGGSAALRMRHTPCGCRSAHLVEVQPNFRLPPVPTMRRASAMPLFRTQSAAVLTSHAPHGSRARLRVVTRSRDSWRSHVHRTYIAQRVQLFEPQTANVRGRGGMPLVPFSWGGCKGGMFSFRGKRTSPPLSHPHTVWGNHNLVICTPAVFSINFLVPTVSNATSSSASPPIGVTEMTSPSPNVLWWIWSPEES